MKVKVSLLSDGKSEIIIDVTNKEYQFLVGLSNLLNENKESYGPSIYITKL